MAAGIQFTRLVSSSRFGDCAVDYALQRACEEAFEHVLGGLGVGASAPFAATLNRARLDNSIGKIWSTKLTSRERAPRGRRYRSRLTRLTSRCGFRNFHEISGCHVVDVAIYRNVIGNQWVISDTHDILDDALRIVRECQPIDVAALDRPRPIAGVTPAILVQCCSLQTAR